MKKILIFLVALVGTFTVWYYWRNPLITKVRIRDQVFLVDVAVTSKEKERGLGYRESLLPNYGMLFVYNQKGQYTFWMKEMRFPIDIIWIDGKTIVDITQNAPVSTGTPLAEYRPKIAVDKVLEVNAGTVEKTGIAIGDTMEILR
ncbi:DUF192 domain-containing protein [Candidatus Gottesmanbacteria bacterium]|nr:DUF192 domain-containing protein [Candidatus Gottesmanbacteria bacterium]